MSQPKHQIVCPKLPEFKWDNIDSVRRAFENLPALAMQQAWLPVNEPDFAPAIVRAGWRDETLFVFAELTDADIFTRATRHNDHMWELGDAFEIFLRPDTQSAYTELHVTPNNLRLQLRFADAQALEKVRATKSFDHVMVGGQIFDSVTWVEAKAQRWHALAKIPASSICDHNAPMQGTQWHFSFSRYDYTRGREKPVISSTSPHVEPRFHSQQEWGTLTFSP